jgi:hypothetical protein
LSFRLTGPGLLAVAAAGGFAASADFAEIRPILDQHCAGCHSHAYLDRPAIGGGLALDSYDAVVRVIVPGNAGASELVRRLEAADPKLRMPLGAPPLPREAIGLVRRWIDAGAPETTSAANTLPADLGTSPAPDLKLLDVFVPFGHRTPLIPAPHRDSTEKAVVLDIPGALLIEDEQQAAGITLEPYTTGLEVRFGPLAPATAVAFSPDGETLFIGSFGRVIQWHLGRRAVIRELAGVAGNVNSLELSPDGRWLSVAGGNPFAPGEVRLYDTATLELAVTLEAHSEVILDQAFSPDSKRLATVSFDKTVEVWSVADRRRELQIRDHSDTVQCVAFDREGKRIATGSMDRTVKLTDAATGAGLLTINPELKGMLAVAFSPDSRYVLTAGESPEIRWWELADIGESVTERGWKPARRMAGHFAPVYDLRFSPDGTLLASAGADRTVRLWEGSTGRLVRTLIDADDLLYSVVFSPDSQRVAASGGDGLTRVWEARTGRLLLTLAQRPLAPKAAAEWLAVAPEGAYEASPGLRESIRRRGEAKTR